MSKLKRMRLADVLSHVDSSIELAPHVNVFTGVSDSGKSSVLRGAAQLALNKPAGIDLLRHGAKRGNCSEVEFVIETDDGQLCSIVRRRGKSKNEYEVDGKPVLAFGLEVPIEVASKLRLSAHAFQLQSDGNFMLCENDGTVAKMLSGTVGLAEIDNALSLIRKRKTANDTDLRVSEADLLREQQAHATFDGLDDAQDLADRCASLRVAVEDAEAVATGAMTLRGALALTRQGADREIESANKQVVALRLAEQALSEAATALQSARTLATSLRAIPTPINPVLVSRKVALATTTRRECETVAEGLSGMYVLRDKLRRLCPETDCSPAAAAVSTYAGLADECGRLIMVHAATTKLRSEILAIPARTSDDGANMMLRQADAQDRALTAQFALRDAMIVLRESITEKIADCATSDEFVRKAQLALHAFKIAHPTCPECGAEQRHWAKG